MTTIPARFIYHTPAYRCQKKKSGQCLAFVRLDGKRIYLGTYDSPESRGRYHQLIAEWERAGRLLPTPPARITVVEISHLYHAWAKTYYVKHGRTTSEPENIILAFRPLLELFGKSNLLEDSQGQGDVLGDLGDGGLCDPVVLERVQVPTAADAVGPQVSEDLRSDVEQRGEARPHDAKEVRQVPRRHVGESLVDAPQAAGHRQHGEFASHPMAGAHIRETTREGVGHKKGMLHLRLLPVHRINGRAIVDDERYRNRHDAVLSVRHSHSLSSR